MQTGIGIRSKHANAKVSLNLSCLNACLNLHVLHFPISHVTVYVWLLCAKPVFEEEQLQSDEMTDAPVAFSLLLDYRCRRRRRLI